MARQRALLTVGRAAGFALASVAAHTALALSLPIGTAAKHECQSEQLVWLEAAGAFSPGAPQGTSLVTQREGASAASSGPILQARRGGRPRSRPVPPVTAAAATSSDAASTATASSLAQAGHDASTQGAGQPEHGEGAPDGSQASHGALQGTASGGTGAPARGPGLLAVRSPCAGYFPEAARADQGEVKIEVQVDPSGRTRASTVLNEIPKHQGFASAARACAERLRFAPALSAGSPVPGRATLRLTFRRG